MGHVDRAVGSVGASGRRPNTGIAGGHREENSLAGVLLFEHFLRHTPRGVRITGFGATLVTRAAYLSEDFFDVSVVRSLQRASFFESSMTTLFHRANSPSTRICTRSTVAPPRLCNDIGRWFIPVHQNKAPVGLKGHRGLALDEGSDEISGHLGPPSVRQSCLGIVRHECLHVSAGA